jgi:TetR/AcrR family transcriptional regulator, cholesterol catabolism regulator
MLEIERAQKSGRRARNKAEKLVRIEEAARALFAQRGFEATTTRQIAERAEIGIGTLFSYFPEKHDLVVHLFEKDVQGNADRALATVPAGSALVPTLLHMFRTFHDFYEREPELGRVYVSRALFMNEAQRDRLNATNFAALGDLADLVRAAKERGELRDDADPMQCAYHAFSLYYIGLVGWLSGLYPREFHEQQLERGLSDMMRGFGAREEGAR